jgi:hypothetical protein
MSMGGWHGSFLGSRWGVDMEIGATKSDMYQGDQDKERSPMG